MKFHPDRNPGRDSTAEFQRIQRAYETLNDETLRREYNREYPTIIQRELYRQNTQSQRPSVPPSASKPRTKALSDEDQLEAALKSMDDISHQYEEAQFTYIVTVGELQRTIMRLGHEVKDLNSEMAEDAEESGDNVDADRYVFGSEDDVFKYERRLRRRIERDLKVQWIASKKNQVKKEEASFRKAGTTRHDAAHDCSEKMTQLRERIKAREDRKRQGGVRAEEDRPSGSKNANRRHAKQPAAEKPQRPLNTDPTICSHLAWWSKVYGIMACPQCGSGWLFLLECPGCSVRACPKCLKGVQLAAA